MLFIYCSYSYLTLVAKNSQIKTPTFLLIQNFSAPQIRYSQSKKPT
jgi:hypothetical protein